MTHLDPLGSPARWVQVDDRQAICRSDTDAVMGIFATGYVMHQYREWLLTTVANILDDDLVISSAGLLRGGAIAWVEVSVPETITTPEGVDFRPNLLATTSFDGSIATTFKRTVTDDGLRQHPRDLRPGRDRARPTRSSTPGTPSAKLADAREALAMVHTLADDFADEVAILCATTVSDTSGGASWTPTSPLDDGRATPEGRSRTLATKARTTWSGSTGTTAGPRPGPAPRTGCSRRPTPRRTTTPPSAEPPGRSGTLPTPSTAPRPPTTGLPSRSHGLVSAA